VKSPAILCLALSVFVACAAIASLLRSAAASKWLIVASTALGTLGTIAAASRIADSMVGFSAFGLAFASVGCAVSAGMRLRAHSARWVHRFVIYAGYSAVFAAMGIVALSLSSRHTDGKVAWLVLVAAYIVGSFGIFLAKALIIRRAMHTIPEYQASLPSAAQNEGSSYW
jgi:hypothetical protein